MSDRLRKATVIVGRPGLRGAAGTNGTNGANGTAALVNALAPSDTNTTSTTPVNITNLSFPIGANEKWIVDYFIGTGCNGTGGVTFQAAVPSGCSVQLNGLGSGSSQGALIVNITGTGITPAFNTAVFYNGNVRLSCVFKNGPTAGTVQLKVGAGVAGQQATAYTDSSMRAQRVT